MPEGSEIRQRVTEIIRNVDKARLYRGKGGEVMRGGVCHLVRAMAISNVKISNEEDRLYLFEQLLENFKHPNPEIQEEATRAFESFCGTYLSHESLTAQDKIVNQVKRMLESSLTDENVALTRGYNMAFGVMSRKIYEILNYEAFETLLKNSVPKGKEADDAETRKFAIKSLFSAIQRYGAGRVEIGLLSQCIENFY